MFISPQVAIDSGWIKKQDGSPIPADCIQPNAIDFTIDRVFSSVSNGPVARPFKVADVEIDGSLKTVKEFPVYVELTATEDTDPKFDRVPLWTLESRTAYDFLSDFYVEVPEGVAALLIVRSTFNRAGLFVTSGLYDSGYKGNIGAALHNNGNVQAFVGKGVRVGQIAFVRSDSVGSYAGGYNAKAGEDWKEADDLATELARFQAAQMRSIPSGPTHPHDK